MNAAFEHHGERDFQEAYHYILGQFDGLAAFLGPRLAEAPLWRPVLHEVLEIVQCLAMLPPPEAAAESAAQTAYCADVYKQGATADASAFVAYKDETRE